MIASSRNPRNERPDLAIYGGRDPRELPRYTYEQASRATGVPASTIAAWVRGMWYTGPRRKRGHFDAVIRRPDPGDTRLSFHNLIETHVLRALREVHHVRIKTVRGAIRNAERQHGIDRLLISSQLRASDGRLFLDSYFRLEELSPSTQYAMRDLLKEYLKRIHIERWLESEFCPIPKRPENRNLELISVSPFVAFGRPRVRRVGVSTHAVAERFDVGEDPDTIIEDYGLTEEEFKEALLFEANSHPALAA